MSDFSISMQAQTKQFDVWLARSVNLLGKELSEVLVEEAGQLAFAAARITPPTTGSLIFSDPWGKQKKAGVNAVRRDLAKIYATPSMIYGELRDAGKGGDDAAKAVAKGIRQGNAGEVQRILYAYGLGHLAASDIGDFSAVHHKANRSSRTGRAKGGRYVKQIVRNSSALTQYRKRQEKKVGSLKAGWYRAARSLRGKQRWPAWVVNAVGGSGYVVNKSKNRRDPYISVVNTVDYSGAQNSTLRFSDKAVRFRQGVFVRKMKAKAKRVWRN